MDALAAAGAPVRRVLLIGGGAQSEAVRIVAPQVLGLPVEVPSPREYVALGAARQAAWAWTGDADPPCWGDAGVQVYDVEAAAAADPGDARQETRDRYAALREATPPLDERH